MNAPTRIRQRRWFAVTSLIGFLLIGVLAINAQGTPTAITVGENQTGLLSDASSVVQYTLALGAPQSVKIEVLAITPNLQLGFDVLDPGGVAIFATPGLQSAVQGAPNIASAGSYTIEVRGSTAGQFLISVQAGAPLAPPQPLTPDQPTRGTVSAQLTRQAYSFSGSPGVVMLLMIASQSDTSGPVVTLRDADTGETLSLNSAGLVGINYRIPSVARNYLLELTDSGAGTSENFTVCLTAEGSGACGGVVQVSPLATPTVIVALPTPTLTPIIIGSPAPATLDPNGSCQVTPSVAQNVNVRSGPGTNYSIVGTLMMGQTGLVIGRLPDNSWFQVNVNGVLGWISATVVLVGGNCAGVSVVILPTATPSPTFDFSSGMTATAQAQINLAATQTRSVELGATGTRSVELTATAQAGGGGGTQIFHPPIIRVTLIAPIIIVPVNPKLDYTASANYGEANLSAGFSPDPYSVGMTTGGNVDVSYLGSSCSGFATSHPDLRINFGGGGASLLRIYFVGSNGDAAMVVNDPYGNFYCVDDSFGTVNPTIDFNNPAGGSYDVWVASYAANTTISGTLYITENSGNHP